MTLVEESIDNIMEAINYLNNDNVGIPKPKYKKKHDRSSVELTLNHCAETNISIEEFNENMIKNKKHEINEIADITLESNCYINNKDVYTQKSKKKKKHDRSFLASTFNHSKNPCVPMCPTEEPHEVTLEENNVFNNEDLEVQKSKKKKKHDRKSIEHIFNSSTDMNVSKKCIEKSHDNSIKQKKPKSNIIDTSFESISNVNDEDNNIQKSKKKKNHNKSSRDAISYNRIDPYISQNLCEESNDNLVKRRRINKIAVATLENNSYISNEDIITQKSKKKKKCDSVASTSNYSEDPCTSMSPVENLHDITSGGNNYFTKENIKIQKSNISKKCIKESNENIIKQKKPISFIIDTSFDNMSNVNDEDKIIKKSKKINHDKSSLEAICNNRTDSNTSQNLCEESNENLVKKKKRKVNEIAVTTLESNSYVNDEDKIIKKSKKINHDKSSIEAICNNRTDSNTSQNLCEESNENLVKKKKRKVNEIAVTTLESNSYVNDEDKIIKKSKKINHDKSSIEAICNNRTDSNTSQNLCEESNENLVKKKKRKVNEIAVTTLDNNSYVNNEDKNIQKSKKKKKRDRSSVTSTSNYCEDPCVSVNLFEKSHDVTLEGNNYFKNENLKIQKPKKKKKHDRKSIEPNFDSCSDIKINQVSKKCIEDSYENTMKQKKPTSFIIDTSFESICNIGDEDKNIQKSKKMKNHDRSSIDVISNNRMDPYTSQNLCEEASENLVEKKKCDINEIALTTLERICNIDDEDKNVQKFKKMKNHDRSSIEDICNNRTDPNTSQNICEESNENLVEKKKCDINEIAVTTLERISYVNDDDKNIKKSKKINHDKSSIEAISNHRIDSDTSQNLCEESNENLVKKKKCDINEIAVTTLESISYVNDDDKNIKKSKKINHDKSSIEAISNNSTDSNISKNVNEVSNEYLVKTKKNDEIADTILKNNSYINDEGKNIQKYMKMKNQARSSIYAISNYSKDSFMAMDLVEKSSDRDDKTDISINIKSSQQNLIEPLDVDETFNISSKNMSKSTSNENNLHIKLEYNSDFINPNSEEKKVVEDILQAINLFKLENPSTTEEKVNLGEYNLIDRILKSNPSIYNHKDIKFIKSSFSMFMKSSINIESQVVTQSDIILLESIGKHVLEKITDAHDKSKIIEKDLHIELPPKCQNNKIHYIETALISQLDKEKKKLINQLNPAFKSGRFSKEEDNMIHKYWLKFQQEYNISDPGPFLSIRSRGLMKLTLPTKIKLQFIRYISAELPNRLLSNVYHRFNVLYRKLVNKISFSEEEDEIIMIVDSCEAIKNKFSLLSFLLNRYKELIYKRKISLKMKPFRGSYIFWDVNKLQKLFRTILLETKTEDWNDLKNIKIKQDTWKKISKHFDENINYEKCQTQWNFLKTRLFCKSPIKYSTFKIIVLELLLEINPQNWSDLNWIEITDKLYPGASSKVINTIFHWWITRKVPAELRQDVRLTLKYLEANCLDSEKEKVETGREKELIRLTVEHNNILVELNKC